MKKKRRKKKEKKRRKGETVQKQRHHAKDIKPKKCLCMIEHYSGKFNAC